MVRVGCGVRSRREVRAVCCGGSLSLRIVIVASRIVTLMIVVRWRLFSKVSDMSFHSLRRVNQIR